MKESSFQCLATLFMADVGEGVALPSGSNFGQGGDADGELQTVVGLWTFALDDALGGGGQTGLAAGQRLSQATAAAGGGGAAASRRTEGVDTVEQLSRAEAKDAAGGGGTGSFYAGIVAEDNLALRVNDGQHLRRGIQNR